MHDIRQFKPVLYALVLLGITGFAMAAESLPTWTLAVGAILLNMWLVKTGRFRPMPRLAANAVTIGSLVLLALSVEWGYEAPILTIGQFLVLLQVIKFYEQRANRDFAQILVLSLLLVVAASISTASVLFGLMLVGYLLLALYCCLLLHLKAEADQARHAVGITDEAEGGGMLRQEHKTFSRSMRRLTGVVATFATAAAILTFLFFPRYEGAGLLAAGRWSPSEMTTGFSGSVDFQNVARITQNTEPVAWVAVTRNGEPYRGMLLLRGMTLDRYTGLANDRRDNPYQWKRTVSSGGMNPIAAGAWWYAFPETDQGDISQKITLVPTGTNVLFAIGGVTAFKPENIIGLRFSRQDGAMQVQEAPGRTIQYEVVSREQVLAPNQPRPATNPQDQPDAAPAQQPLTRPRTSSIDPKIEEFARRAEVSGSDGEGPLAARRDKNIPISPLDAAIARDIESYLRSNFTYTLDLTDASRIEGQDPMVAFLYDLKRGHCEYFAGAMTLMCQSLGMQARMVVGFLSDEYNEFGHYHTVRQSHAHAWVEVLNESGVWQTFDPTSSREDTTVRSYTLWQRMRSVFSLIEYTWQSSVIAYDPRRQTNLVQNVQSEFESAATQSREALHGAWNWQRRPMVSLTILNGLVILIMAMIAFSVLWYVLEQWRLRRRARRIGLDALPSDEQKRLAKQLGFYDVLLRLLERYRITRPAHLTPLEFSHSLAFLPSEAYDLIRRLTELFYRVRYGRAELSGEEQRKLFDVIADVETSLNAQHRP